MDRISHKITLDFQQRGVIPKIYANQNEVESRSVDISLYNAGQKWTAPAGVTVAISYIKPDGIGGEYDHLPDGSEAWSFNTGRDVVSILLAPQMFTTAGDVHCKLRFLTGASSSPVQVLSTFRFDLVCDRDTISGGESDPYFSVRSFDQMYTAIDEAKADAEAASTSYTLPVLEHVDGKFVSNSSGGEGTNASFGIVRFDCSHIAETSVKITTGASTSVRYNFKDSTGSTLFTGTLTANQAVVSGVAVVPAGAAVLNVTHYKPVSEFSDVRADVQLKSVNELASAGFALGRDINAMSGKLNAAIDALDTGMLDIDIKWLPGALTGMSAGQTVRYTSGYDGIRKYVFASLDKPTHFAVQPGYRMSVSGLADGNVSTGLNRYSNAEDVTLDAGSYAIMIGALDDADISDIDMATVVHVYLAVSFGELKSLAECDYQYTIANVLCIGDSLTEGDYYGHDWPDMPSSAHRLAQNYPSYLSRMIAATVTNGGVSGYTAINWYNNVISRFDLASYDTFLLWLGTNGGFTDTLDDDVIAHKTAGEGYEDFAETNTGCYCKIIEKIKADNPDAFIVILNLFAVGTGHSYVTDNPVLVKIAELYSLPIIDMSDLGFERHPELHAGIQNVHFGKAGNIYIADRICREIKRIIAGNPLKAEFGLSQGTRYATYEH